MLIIRRLPLGRMSPSSYISDTTPLYGSAVEDILNQSPTKEQIRRIILLRKSNTAVKD